MGFLLEVVRMKHAQVHGIEHRVIALLGRDQVDFLDKISKDALFSTGSKLSRTKIISAMVDVLKDLHVSGRGVKTSDELERKILEAMQNPSKGGE